MAKVHRMGDSNNAGGIIISIPQSRVTVGGILVAVETSSVSGHPPGTPPHLSAVTTATRNVTIGGRRVTVEGDIDTCGHSRVSGSARLTIL